MDGSRTIEIIVSLDDEWHEHLIAELADLDFEAFETDDGVVRAFIPAMLWSDVTRESVENWLQNRGFQPAFSEAVHEPENWNRTWEETVQPFAVGPFLIKPTWAAVPREYRELILLEIDPKMSFGTGYHESTRLALRALAKVMRPGDRVLDAGTGTGILAIAAARLGASTVVAFDIDEWSYVNATENCLLNEVGGVVAVRMGSIETVRQDEFDLIMANINRHVVLEMLPLLRKKLAGSGRMVLAGLLVSDRKPILNAAKELSLKTEFEDFENEWWSTTFVPVT